MIRTVSILLFLLPVLGSSSAIAESPTCTTWNVRDYCCPAACAAYKSANWERANPVLRGCMAGLSCSESERSAASVELTCNCGDK